MPGPSRNEARPHLSERDMLMYLPRAQKNKDDVPLAVRAQTKQREFRRGNRNSTASKSAYGPPAPNVRKESEPSEEAGVPKIGKRDKGGRAALHPITTSSHLIPSSRAARRETAATVLADRGPGSAGKPDEAAVRFRSLGGNTPGADRHAEQRQTSARADPAQRPHALVHRVLHWVWNVQRPHRPALSKAGPEPSGEVPGQRSDHLRYTGRLAPIVHEYQRLANVALPGPEREREMDGLGQRRVPPRGPSCPTAHRVTRALLHTSVGADPPSAALAEPRRPTLQASNQHRFLLSIFDARLQGARGFKGERIWKE
ncbi:hypothetical protein FB451DRAFT_1451051 [Mycena latifolia]|nr:hypothetical protein FB451DRAFT_1451051 [Mycena latifolia]